LHIRKKSKKKKRKKERRTWIEGDSGILYHDFSWSRFAELGVFEHERLFGSWDEVSGVYGCHGFIFSKCECACQWERGRDRIYMMSFGRIPKEALCSVSLATERAGFLSANYLAHRYGIMRIVRKHDEFAEGSVMLIVGDRTRFLSANLAHRHDSGGIMG
jgi:hypothetical protein